MTFFFFDPYFPSLYHHQPPIFSFTLRPESYAFRILNNLQVHSSSSLLASHVSSCSPFLMTWSRDERLLSLPSQWVRHLQKNKKDSDVGKTVTSAERRPFLLFFTKKTTSVGIYCQPGNTFSVYPQSKITKILPWPFLFVSKSSVIKKRIAKKLKPFPPPEK